MLRLGLEIKSLHGNRCTKFYYTMEIMNQERHEEMKDITCIFITKGNNSEIHL